MAGALVAACSHHLVAQSLTTVRFTVGSAAAADSVRRLGIDVVEIRPRADQKVDLVAVVGPADRTLLLGHGWMTQDVARRFAAPPAPNAWTVYRDFDDPVRGVAAWMRAFDASHANVVVDSIGASVQGRPILAAKIGQATDDPLRPNLVFLATYHAREWASTEMALRLMQYFADSLPLTPEGVALLGSRDIWVIPVVNPDGYEYTFTTDRLWRKNLRPNGSAAPGVDLNRNHSAFWGFDDAGSSPLPASEVYRGPSAASEPEVRAIEAFHRAHPPTASISFHTYTGTVLYPWSHMDGTRTGDDAVFRGLAGTDIAPAILDSIPGSTIRYYHPGPGWQLYPTNGDYTSWAYRTFRTAAFTVELTSGCCTNGQYYGFEFPDDDAMLTRMFRDNLPFVMRLLREAVNLGSGPAYPGAAGSVAQFESVWPELDALLDSPANSQGAPVDVATDSGAVGFLLAGRDTLGVGRRFVRKIAVSPMLRDARAIRLPIDGLSTEILLRDGAEVPLTGWRGFTRTTQSFEGARAWLGFTDTLLSPAINVAGRSSLAVSFWTHHAGSVFNQASRGRVQVSTDNGATWTTVAQVLGAAPRWYPVRADMPAVAGASSIRLRFLADSMSWWIDAVSVTASDAAVNRLFTAISAPATQTVQTSANPVRAAPVVLRWTAGPGSARADVFSLAGTRVITVDLGADPGRWSWDLTTQAGEPLANGAYFVVITLGDGTHLRRRLLVAR